MPAPSLIRVSQSNPEIWNGFHRHTTEMIVTKLGRKLFPDLDFDIKGLYPDAIYTIYLYLERVDDMKYTFNSSSEEWDHAQYGEEILPIVKKMHKDGGRPGSYWMQGSVSFSDVRITNDPNFMMKKGQKEMPILVQSMHKYRPVICVKRDDGVEDEFRIENTEFMVVTAYQNKHINELKKSLNKFCSGFGPNGKHTENKKEREAARGKKRSASPTTVYPSPPPTVSPPVSSMTPINFGSSTSQSSYTPPINFSNQLLSPPVVTPPTSSLSDSHLTPPPTLTPPIHPYPYWNQYAMWNMNGAMPQWIPMASGVENFQNFSHFGANFPQYPNLGSSASQTESDNRKLEFGNEQDGKLQNYNFDFPPF